MQRKKHLDAMSRAQMRESLKSFNLPKYRFAQIESWIWDKGVLSFEEMSNLPQTLRKKLASEFVLSTFKIIEKQISVDGTKKYLVRFDDGVSVEAVGIPSCDNSHLTVCFSTQAGCPVACSFCATGQMGFTRNLSVAEIVNQVRLVSNDFGIRANSVVAMGQGEPFLNYDTVLEALRIINSSPAFKIGARHITVSSCGILEGIRHFTQEPEQFTLAISLHAAIQTTRDRLMPGVHKHPLTQLREALNTYTKATHRRPSLEYVLIKGVNDDSEHLNALVSFCKNMLCHVNLISLNPIDKNFASNNFAPSLQIKKFKQTLEANKINVSIRQSRGADIAGACGQLKQREMPLIMHSETAINN